MGRPISAIKITKECLACGVEFQSYISAEQKLCSRKCVNIFNFGNQNRKNHFGSYAGRQYPEKNLSRIKDGYILVFMPEHPLADKSGHYREHRYMCECILGRFLDQDEVPHHINGIGTDNRPENLYLFSKNGIHMKYHFSKNKPTLESNLYKLITN